MGSNRLSLFDSICLIVGIIIGVGVFQVSPVVASSTNSLWVLFGLWVVGGVISLFGAFGYAELSETYQGQGGDYAYLNQAYGPWAGFLFGWIQMTVIRPGEIALMSFIVGTYATQLWSPFLSIESSQIFYSSSAVLICTGFNLIGIQSGKLVQNILTVVKAIGILMVVFFSFAGGQDHSISEVHTRVPLSIALILVLFSYGGWSEIVYVTSDVLNPKKNMFRAMFFGIALVMVIYLILTAAFYYSLGLSGMANSP